MPNKNKNIQDHIEPLLHSAEAEVSRLRKFVNRPIFSTAYLCVSVVILLFSVLYWGILSAKVQLGNADSLVNAYLFKNSAFFHGASFPGQHTFLLKWPLFILIKVFSFSNSAYVGATVAVVLVTILGFAFILWRIEHRKLVLGTLLLALSSILLMVPNQPYPGALLPVGMAMLTTRNIEYLVYIIALVLLAKARRIASWRFWMAVVLLAVLVASDKYFMGVGLVAAVVALAVYSLARSWPLVSMAAHWLLAQAIAAVAAISVLGLINTSHLTHINSSAGVGPYGLSSLHDGILGLVFGVLGLLTNLGANLAYDVGVVRNLPHAALQRLHSISGPGHLINLALALVGFYIVGRLLYQSLVKRPRGSARPAAAVQLMLMLAWSTVAALGLFVLSKHYWAADARYLGIVLFAVMVAAAVYSRNYHWKAEPLVGIGIILILVIGLNLHSAKHRYNNEQTALATVNQRNTSVADIIKSRPTDVLVGDYWRVVPIMHQSGNNTVIMPLANCTQPRKDLSTQAWQPDLNKHSFSYLLNYDIKLTDYPTCTLKQVTDDFGHPNASVLVAGTPSSPHEQLLIYDKGIRKSNPVSAQTAAAPSTVVPTTLDQYPHLNCSGPSVLVVVAHEDDDLLFMNPDLQHLIQQGYCVRTIYVTAGDAGFGQYYWLSREQGSEAAYSAMLGTSNDLWTTRTIQLAGGQYVSIANPTGNNKVSLVFMHLPDGSPKGQGFADSSFESLAKLESGQIPALQAIDHQSTFNHQQLVDSLSQLMQAFAPAEIFTQSSYAGTEFPDHNDHGAVGKMAKQAYDQYEKVQYNNLVILPLHYYLGYPVHEKPANINDGDLQSKIDIFLNYAKYDGGVCHSQTACMQNQAYGAYLPRQYQNPN